MNKLLKIILFIVAAVGIVLVSVWLYFVIKCPLHLNPEYAKTISEFEGCDPNYISFTYDDIPFYSQYNSSSLKDPVCIKTANEMRESADGQYMITDYKNGVCIHRYLGNEKDVIIPDRIDGKKVLKIGRYFRDIGESDFNYFTLNAFGPDYSVENPEDYDFIRSIHLAKYVKEIEADAFIGCHKLKRITVDPENQYYKSFCGMLFSRQGNHLLCAPMLLIDVTRSGF